MASRLPSFHPWPEPTPHSSLTKGKRKRDTALDQSPPRVRKHPRQSAATAQSNNCGLVDNTVISCFPTASAVVTQNQWTRVVWNTNLPQFSQTNLVDVWLIHADSGETVETWTNQPYGVGHLDVLPNDTWWGEKGLAFTPGQNSFQPFVFAVVRNGADRNSQPPQTTFTATQTTFLNSVIASQSSASIASASSAASSRSAASVSSASAAAAAASSSSALSSSKSSAAATSTPGSLQNSSNSSDNFPHWAIALLAVFGFLAFISLLFVLWLLIRNLRSRKQSRLEHRNSIGSQSPMMANAAPQSPVNAPAGSSIAHGDPQSTESHLAPLPAISPRPNILTSDGASTASRADSVGGPFSAVDAAAMAAAFRNVMRKPDFADRPMEEGESPEQKDGEPGDVLNRELAEEGRDIRSVSSSRGVRVETLSDSGDTAH